jgi:hypothetical protein
MARPTAVAHTTSCAHTEKQKRGSHFLVNYDKNSEQARRVIVAANTHSSALACMVEPKGYSRFPRGGAPTKPFSNLHAKPEKNKPCRKDHVYTSCPKYQQLHAGILGGGSRNRPYTPCTRGTHPYADLYPPHRDT